MTLTAEAQREAMMTWAFENSSNATLFTNLKHEIQIVNKSFLDWFGFTEEEVIGNHAGELLHSKSLGGPDLSFQIVQSLDSKGQWQGEVSNWTKSSLEKICLISISTIHSSSGEKIGYLGVMIDLTERKELEAEIAQGEKLAHIGESVAMLMHEIRNPLCGISMNVFMLDAAAAKGGNWSKADADSVKLISKEVSRLEGLVRCALTYARNSHYCPEKVSVKLFFNEMKELVLQTARKNSVEIHIDPLCEDLWALFDLNSMKQVFINLLLNAIHTASQSSERVVRIGARIAEDPKWRCISSSARVLLLSVDNSGDRISEQERKNIFKPFFTTKSEGVGLGLAIASKIVRQHHGVLGHSQIKDAPYTTRFTMALPI